MKLTNWEVEGYKSISTTQEVEFGDINVFVGENNTGKSSVIDALRDYKETLFPVALNVDSEWAHSRTTGKKTDGDFRILFEFELNEVERDEFFERISGDEDDWVISERSAQRYFSKGWFKRVEHELRISCFPTPSEPVIGKSIMRANVDGEMVDIRNGGLEEDSDDTEYLNFNKISQEYSTSSRKKEWVELKEVMGESIGAWEFVDSFRAPESLLPAERDLELDDKGDNLSRVLLTLMGEDDERFQDISDKYADIMEGVQKIRAPLQEEDQTTVVVDEDVDDFDSGFSLDEVSAGSKEILTLITQIVLASGEADLLLIEEPELHLHPDAEREIFQFIEEQLNGNGTQVILSTHSSVFSRHDYIDNVIRVKRDGYSELIEVTEKDLNGELRELGYHYSSMFQSDAVVVVEGLSDRKVFREMAQKYDYNLEDHRIGIVDMEDKSKLINHSRNMVKLFTVFSIPYLFILDLDDEDSTDALKGELVEFIRRDGDEDIWWDEATFEDIHVWEQDELEAYLLDDTGAVAEEFSLEESEVEDIIEECDEGPEEQLEAVCQEARPGLSPDDAFDKVRDTYDLALEVDLENVSSEFHDVMEKIAGLVDEEHIIEEKRP